MDRQIGDRRGRNSIEQKVIGPSTALPTGPLLTDLFLNARHQTLRVSISDRKDFYHQIQCTPSKAQCNTIGVLEEKDLEGLKAYDDFKQAYRPKYVRSSHGDRLGNYVGSKWTPSKGLKASFRGILQGDHGGVEYATDAHVNLLLKV